MAGNIVIGTLRAHLTADTAEFSSRLKSAGAEAESFKGTIQGIGKTLAAAFSFHDIAAGIANVVDKAGAIADAASRMGIGAEAVQRLGFAAEQSGASLEAVGTAIRSMSSNITDGGKSSSDAVSALGLSLDALRGMSPEQAFTAIADAIKEVPDPMQQSALAVDLFGRSGSALLPAIKAGFTEVGAQAPVMSAAVVQSADESGDAWARMQAQMDALKAQAVAPLLEAFTSMPATVQTAVGGLAAFAPSLETLTMAVIGAGGPVKALGMLKSAAVAAAGFFSMSGALGTALTAMAGFFTTTLPAAFGAVIAFLGPQGIIAAALLALAGIWYAWGDEIKAAVTGVYTTVKDWLVDKFSDTIVGDIARLLLAIGKLFGALAIEAAQAAMKVFNAVKEWLLDKLEPVISKVKAFFGLVQTAWTIAKDSIVGIATAIYTGVKSWLVDKFAAIVEAVREKIRAVTKFFEDMYDKVVGNSFVPDMVRRIGEEFGTLDSKMVSPTRLATDGVTELFRTMGINVSGELGTLLDGLVGKVVDWGGRFLPEWAQGMLGMAGGAEDGTRAVIESFDGMGEASQASVDSMLSGISGMLNQWLFSDLPKWGQALMSQLSQYAQSAIGQVATLISQGITAATNFAFGSSGNATSGSIGGSIGAIAGSFIPIPGGSFIGAAVGSLIGNLIGPDEEERSVNPARDAFFQRFVDRYHSTPYDSLAQAFAEAGVRGDVAERLIGQIYAADTMREFDTALRAVSGVLPGFVGGTPGLGFQDFGAGQLAVLHGREAVVPEDQAVRFATNVLGGSSGSPDVVRAIGALEARLMRTLDTMHLQAAAVAQQARGRGLSYA